MKRLIFIIADHFTVLNISLLISHACFHKHYYILEVMNVNDIKMMYVAISYLNDASVYTIFCGYLSVY